MTTIMVSSGSAKASEVNINGIKKFTNMNKYRRTVYVNSLSFGKFWVSSYSKVNPDMTVRSHSAPYSDLFDLVKPVALERAITVGAVNAWGYPGQSFDVPITIVNDFDSLHLCSSMWVRKNNPVNVLIDFSPGFENLGIPSYQFINSRQYTTVNHEVWCTYCRSKKYLGWYSHTLGRWIHVDKRFDVHLNGDDTCHVCVRSGARCGCDHCYSHVYNSCHDFGVDGCEEFHCSTVGGIDASWPNDYPPGVNVDDSVDSCEAYPDYHGNYTDPTDLPSESWHADWLFENVYSNLDKLGLCAFSVCASEHSVPFSPWDPVPRKWGKFWAYIVVSPRDETPRWWWEKQKVKGIHWTEYYAYNGLDPDWGILGTVTTLLPSTLKDMGDLENDWNDKFHDMTSPFSPFMTTWYSELAKKVAINISLNSQLNYFPEDFAIVQYPESLIADPVTFSVPTQVDIFEKTGKDTDNESSKDEVEEPPSSALLVLQNVPFKTHFKGVTGGLYVCKNISICLSPDTNSFSVLEFPDSRVMRTDRLIIVDFEVGSLTIQMIYDMKTQDWIPVTTAGFKVFFRSQGVYKFVGPNFDITVTDLGKICSCKFLLGSDSSTVLLSKIEFSSVLHANLLSAVGDILSARLDVQTPWFVPFAIVGHDSFRIGNMFHQKKRNPTILERAKRSWIPFSSWSTFVVFIAFAHLYTGVKNWACAAADYFASWWGFKRVKQSVNNKVFKVVAFLFVFIAVLYWLLKRKDEKTGREDPTIFSRFKHWVSNVSAVLVFFGSTLALAEWLGYLETEEVSDAKVKVLKGTFFQYGNWFKSLSGVLNIKTGADEDTPFDSSVPQVFPVEPIVVPEEKEFMKFIKDMNIRIPKFDVEKLKHWISTHKFWIGTILLAASAAAYLIYRVFKDNDCNTDNYVVACSVTGDEPVLTKKDEIKLWFDRKLDTLYKNTDHMSRYMYDCLVHTFGKNMKTGGKEGKQEKAEIPDSYYKKEGTKTRFYQEDDDWEETNKGINSGRHSRGSKAKKYFNEGLDEANPTTVQYDNYAEWMFHTAAEADKKIAYDDLGNYGRIIIIMNTGTNGIQAIPLKGNEDWKKMPDLRRTIKAALQNGHKVVAKVYDPSKRRWLGNGKKVYRITNQKTGLNAENALESIGTIRGVTSGAATVVKHPDWPVPRIVFCRHHLQDNKNSNLYNIPECSHITLTFGGVSTLISTEQVVVERKDIDNAYVPVSCLPNAPPALPVCTNPARTAGSMVSMRNGKHYLRNVFISPPAMGTHYDGNIQISVAQDDPILPGDSGSPLLNSLGQVIGFQEGIKGSRPYGVSLFEKQFTVVNTTDEEVRKNLGDRLQFYEKKKRLLMEKTGASIFAEYPSDLGFSPKKIDFFKDCAEFDEFIGDSDLVVKVGSYPINVYTRKPSLFLDEGIASMAREIGFDYHPNDFAVSEPNMRTAYKDLSKYTVKNTFAPDFELAYQAVRMVRAKFSFLTGFRAIPKMKAITSMQFSKASGFPANLKYPTKGAFLVDHTNWLLDFMELYDSTDESYGLDLPQEMLQLCSKVEIRDIERIKAEKNRTFKNQGTEYSAFERMVFGEALDRAAEHDYKLTGVLVGYSPYYGGFDDFVRWINMDDVDSDWWNKKDCIDMDAKKFDRSLIYPIQKLIDEEFWTPLCGDVRTTHLIKKFTKCMCTAWSMMPDGNIVRIMYGAMWSGRQMTLLLNSIFNQIVAHYACLRFGHSPYDILNHIRIATVGDDLKIVQRTARKMTPVQCVQFYREFNIELEGNVELERFADHPFCGLTPNRVTYQGWFTFIPDVSKICFSMVCRKKRMTKADMVEKIIQLCEQVRFTPVFEKALALTLRVCHQALEHDVTGHVQSAWSKHNVYALDLKHIPLKTGSGLNDSAYKFINTMEYVDPIKHYASKFLPEPYDKLLDGVGITEKGEFSYRHRGQWCGPGYSNGKRQASVQGQLSDNFDDAADFACMRHDTQYATEGADLAYADAELAAVSFAEQDYAMAAAIGAQGILRYLGVMDRYNVSSLTDLSTAIDKEMVRNHKKGDKKVVKKLKQVEKKVHKAEVRIMRAKKVRAKTARKPNRRVSSTVGISAPMTKHKYKMRVVEGKGETSIFVNLPLTSVTTVASGDPIIQDVFVVSPSLFGGSRVYFESLMYTRYDVRYRLSYHCQCPATTGGSGFWFFHNDPASSFSIGDPIDNAQVPQLQGFEDYAYYTLKEVQSNWYGKKGLYTMADRPLNLALVPSADIKFTSAGTIVLGAFSPHSSAINGGKMFLEAEFRFYDKSASLPIDFMLLQCTTIPNAVLAQYTPTTSNYSLGPLSNINPIDGFTCVANVSNPGTKLDLQFKQPGNYYVMAAAVTGTTSSMSATIAGGTKTTTFGSTSSVSSTIFFTIKKSSAPDTGATLTFDVGAETTSFKVYISRLPVMPSFMFTEEEKVIEPSKNQITPKPESKESDPFATLKELGLLRAFAKAKLTRMDLTVDEFLNSQHASDNE